MRYRGRLKTWNDERGFGFIESAQAGQDVFVHITAFPPGTGRPTIGQALTFEVNPGPNGKQRAESVHCHLRNGQARHRRLEPPAAWTLPRLLVIPAFLFIWLYVAFKVPVNPVVLVLYICISILTFFVYANDKSSAIHGRWRTPENTLHLLSMAGGWPGGLLAQQLLRHKCSKTDFVAVFWLTVALNILFFLVFHLGLAVPR